MFDKLKKYFTNLNNGKIDLNDTLNVFYGKHRSGWLYALESLKPLQNKNGVYFDSFIERTFNWHPEGKQVIRRPWVGVIHVPPNIPTWFQNEQSNDAIFKTKEFQDSLPFCQGLFTLSEYHKKSLESKISIPINNLFFPTETPETKWSWKKFQGNKEKKVFQIGWWLRKLHSIYQLKTKSYRKIFIKIDYADVDGVMQKEREILKNKGQFNDEMYNTVTELNFLSNNDYDNILSENIVIANLYDSSANNLISECIVRNTPILVNPIKAVVEYLGEDYPFYFNSLEEASNKLENSDLVFETHSYLKEKLNKKRFSADYFRESFKNSDIYKNLAI